MFKTKLLGSEDSTEDSGGGRTAGSVESGGGVVAGCGSISPASSSISSSLSTACGGSIASNNSNVGGASVASSVGGSEGGGAAVGTTVTFSGYCACQQFAAAAAGVSGGSVVCVNVEKCNSIRYNRKSRKSCSSRSIKMSHSSSSSMRGGSAQGSRAASGASSAYDMTSANESTKSVSPGSYSCNALNVDFSTFSTTHQWKQMEDCAEFVGAKRSKHTVVAYKNAMFVFGGDNGKTMLNDLIRFSVNDKSWGRACPTGQPPAPRYHHSAVVYNSSMFVFGGYTGDIHSNSNLTNKNDLFEYKFKTAMWVEWKFEGRMPVARSAHGSAVYDNKLWIYAGYDGNARLNDMWLLDITTDIHKWEEVEQKGERPPTCCNFPVAVARDCMYVFSGQSGLQITNSLFEFHFKTRTWRRISNESVLRGANSAPPSRRYGHTMVHHDRFLYVFGGSADSTLPNDLHCYDLDSQVWSVITPEVTSDVPSGRVFHASAVIGDAMFIFGGTVDNSVRRGDTYRFQLTSYPKCTLRDDFVKFFHEKQFCDIQFIVGPEDIKILAHIAFVASRSQYLRSKILAAREARQKQMEKVFGMAVSGDMSSFSSGVGGDSAPMLEVRLSTASPEAFEIILNFIYTDRIDLKESYSKNIVILLADIYQMAGLFLMPRLAQGCIQMLDFKINKQNVLEALYNAHHNKIQIIKDHLIQFIIKDENYADVIMSSEYSDLDQPLVVAIQRKHLFPGKMIVEANSEKNVGTTLESDMAVFLESTGKDFCDINLILEGHVIPAHKSILSARCSYFQGMFRSFMPPDNTVNIQIGEVAPSVEAVQSLLRYIYYGETKLPPQDALYLFQASCFYGLSNNRLGTFCKYSLEHNITYENVLQTLEASDITKIHDIKDYALKLIVKEFPKVAQLQKIASLSHELLLEIIYAVAESHAEFLTRISINTDI